jgi:hypothetical protein
VRDLKGGASATEALQRERLDRSQKNEMENLKRRVDAAVRKGEKDDRKLARDLC